MKRNSKQFTGLSIILFFVILAFASCSPQIELTSSWTNKNVKVKSSPMVMVMVLGKDLSTRQLVETYIVSELQSQGYKAMGALEVFKPEVQQYDSATMVSILREKNIDMLLTNAVVNVSEKQTYVEGTTQQVPIGTYSTPNNPYYANNYYYNNYYSSNMYYQTMYETRTTPGYTYTDVEVIIESKLYDVAIPELIWFGQSKSYTKDPSTSLFYDFAKIVVGDITKNNLLVK